LKTNVIVSKNAVNADNKNYLNFYEMFAELKYCYYIGGFNTSYEYIKEITVTTRASKKIR
jgi:hypothetical protein